jgi:glycosyltransferase involved in cell wall biosynthesis
MDRLTNFSVIVPVYNGEDELVKCLTSLLSLRYPSSKYEIIVVNDGSTDQTSDIATQYPVQVIDLKSNQGRVVARNEGAKAAKFETLVFNDVRVIPEKDLLRKVSSRNYQPLIPAVEDYDGSKWGFSRLFYLLRLKIYTPYYPLSELSEEFMITQNNFDQAPKGTTNFVCDRKLWLKCQPDHPGRETNDDTRILRCIVQRRSILRPVNITVTYNQRKKLGDVIGHMYERGPRFADYYLRKGGHYRPFYLFLFLILLGFFLAVLLSSSKDVVILSFLFFLWLCLTGVAVYLQKTIRDVIVVITCFPVVVMAFGLGILKWQAMQIINWLFPDGEPG